MPKRTHADFKVGKSRFEGIDASNLLREKSAYPMRKSAFDTWRRVSRSLGVFFDYKSAVFSLLLLVWVFDAVTCHAEQRPDLQRSAIPTFDSLRHQPVPSSGFFSWCGVRDRYFVKVGGISGKLDVFDAGVKSSTLVSSGGECRNDGLYVVSNRDGQVLKVEIGSNAAQLLATYEKREAMERPAISVSPDFKHVLTDRSLNLSAEAGNPKLVQLNDREKVKDRSVRWSYDSSMLLTATTLVRTPDVETIDILNEQGQKIGSGNLPAGTAFHEGWFDDDMQHLLLFIASSQNKFGQGIIVKCAIKEWKCDPIAERVDDVTSDGRRVFGTVSALRKTTETEGDSVVLPSQYVVEVRDQNTTFVRQIFSAAGRSQMRVIVAPSGGKAVVTWISERREDCRWGLRKGGWCVAGMIVDFSGVVR